jgi:hypothetical protein
MRTKGAMKMETVVIQVPSKDKSMILTGDKFGQLALCPFGIEDWSITHIASGMAIEFIQCPRDQAEIIMNELQEFDFDAYYEKTKRGETDVNFVKLVKWTLVSWEAKGW